MKILLIAATAAEIQPFREYLHADKKLIAPDTYMLNSSTIEIQVTGIGPVATAYNLGRLLTSHKYDLVIQAGVGGSFDRSISLGDVVMVNNDCFADMGAEDHDNYLDIFEMGLIGKDEAPFSNGCLPALEMSWDIFSNMKAVKGITVSMVSGNSHTIQRLATTYGAVTESMEGAAMHYACRIAGVPFVQLRAVSNYVEPRDKSKWQMGKAIKALNETLQSLANKL